MYVLISIGALCVYEGIVDSLWNGSSSLSMLKKVGQISGNDLYVFFSCVFCYLFEVFCSF